MNLKLNRRQKFGLVAAGMLILTTLATTTQAQSQWTGPDGNSNIYYNSGNVGIGATTPSTLNGVNFGLSFQVNGGGMALTGAPILIFNDTAQAANSRLMDLYSNGGKLLVRSYADQGTGINNIAAFDRGGNVGIGTTAPSANLHVNLATINTDRIAISTDGVNTWRIRHTNDNSDSLVIGNDAGGTFVTKVMTLARSGNVGIGTAAPTGNFHVNNATINTDRITLSTDGVNTWRVRHTNDNTDSLVIGNDVDGTFGTKVMTLARSGNVGIGKTNPDVALDVAGDIKASGVIHAKYQDVAEWVESSEQLAAGTVVVLDSTKSNQVISSSQSYDTRVAGVISAQPGITLGEKSDSKVLVATTGRVKVKVDASKSPIQIGDLLVTSDFPGVAMKSEPVDLAGRKMHMPGTLIGKALEPLAKGKGEILVLLSLQ